MFTRKQYLDGECSFTDYYLDIADAAGLKAFDRSLIERCVAALKAGDEPLNSIPLPTWGHTFTAPAAKALRERGDYPTLAGNVCLWKCIYKRAALKSMRTYGRDS